MAEQITASRFVIAFLLLSAIVSAIFTLTAGFLPDGPTSSADVTQWNETYNKLSAIKQDTENIESDLTDISKAENEFGILDLLVESTVGAITRVWTSVDTFSTMVSELSGDALGIAMPSWFISLVIGVVTAIIAFALMAAYFKWYI